MSYPLLRPQYEFLHENKLDLHEMVGMHAVKLTGGRGFTLPGKDREVIEEVFELSRMETMLPSAEKLGFYQGHCIFTVEKTNDGKARITIPVLWGSSDVAMVGEREQLAVTGQRFIFDHTNYILRTEFTPNTIKRSFHVDNGEGEVLGEAVVLGLSEKIRN